MQRGRKPTPTRLRLLKGNPGGAKRIPKNEPKAKTGKPLRAPSYLSPAAKREYKSAGKMLAELGILANVDHRALELYAETYAIWVEAISKVTAEGMITLSPNGYPVQNAYLSIANAASKRMQNLMAEFGMTPSSRTRVQAPSSDDEGFDRF